MVTRDALKSEIDKVQEQYLAILYNIIKSFEVSTVPEDAGIRKSKHSTNSKDWHRFIDKFAGCLADDPIK